MKKELFDMLMASAVAEKSKALLTLDLLSNHAAGIGDHSTKDFYNNAEEALQMLVDADDKIETLEKYFKK
jgi:hypothetical protein